MASRTGWLLIGSNSLNFKVLEHWLPQQVRSDVCVVRPNTKFDPAHQVRVEPIHSNHIVIGQKRLEPGRVQRSLGQQSLRKITELFYNYHVLPIGFVFWLFADSVIWRILRLPPVSLLLQSLPRNVREFVRLLRDGLQLAVRHGGIEIDKPLSLLLWIGSIHMPPYAER